MTYSIDGIDIATGLSIHRTALTPSGALSEKHAMQNSCRGVEVTDGGIAFDNASLQVLADADLFDRRRSYEATRTSAECRLKADDMAASAAKCTTLDSRAEFLALAQMWRASATVALWQEIPVIPKEQIN